MSVDAANMTAAADAILTFLCSSYERRLLLNNKVDLHLWGSRQDEEHLVCGRGCWNVTGTAAGYVTRPAGTSGPSSDTGKVDPPADDLALSGLPSEASSHARRHPTDAATAAGTSERAAPKRARTNRTELLAVATVCSSCSVVFYGVMLSSR